MLGAYWIENQVSAILFLILFFPLLCLQYSNLENVPSDIANPFTFEHYVWIFLLH